MSDYCKAIAPAYLFFFKFHPVDDSLCTDGSHYSNPVMSVCASAANST